MFHMNKTFEPISRAASIVGGGPAALAHLLDITPAAVSQWLHRRRPVPLRHCAAIERATNGAVTRKDLRPDDWQEIWPDLK